MNFQTLRNKTKSVLSIKESYSMKKAQHFHKCLWSGPPYGQPDRKKKRFGFDDFPKGILAKCDELESESNILP